MLALDSHKNYYLNLFLLSIPIFLLKNIFALDFNCILYQSMIPWIIINIYLRYKKIIILNSSKITYYIFNKSIFKNFMI